MRSLIDNNINVAAVKRTAPPVVEGSETAEAHAKDSRKPSADQGKSRGGGARATPRRARARLHRSDQAQSGEDLHRAGGIMHTASLSPLPSD